MILDKQNLFSEEQNVLATCNSINTIYFGKKDVSYLPLRIQVIVDFTGLSGLTIDVETADNSSFTNSVILASTSLPVSKLKAGAVFPLSSIPKGNLGYMRLKYNVTGMGTTGTICAGVVTAHEQSWQDIETA